MNIMELQFVRTARQRFLALEPRDRFALQGLAVFFAVLFVYFGIWAPANNFFESKLAERDHELGIVKYMRASEARARALKTDRTPQVSGQALLTQVSRTAQQYNINPNRLQPEGSEGVSVWFDDVVFNDLVRWLELQSQQGVTIRQISIDRQQEPGKVNARVVLRS